MAPFFFGHMRKGHSYMTVDTGSSGQKIIPMEYPSNSHSANKKEAPRKIEKVIQGSVRQRKKSLGRKFSESFLDEDSKSVSGYVIYDVIVPAIKSMLADMVGGGIEMLLFGETKGSRTRRDRGKSYVSYSSFYRDRDRDSRDRRDTSYRRQAQHDFDDIVLDSRGEGEAVLSQLADLVDDYGSACVSDLYQLVGLPTNYTDNKYGWTNLSRATVERTRDGYILNLPKTVLLD